MKSLILVAGLLGAPIVVGAQQRPSSQAVLQDRQRAADVTKAACNSAVQGLYNDISAMPLTASTNVGRFLQVLEKREEFVGELYRADQIGAPRWVNSHTCQVQLEVATPVAMRALVRMAAANPRSAPVSALQIERASARWPRQFIATGTATSDTVIRFKPTESAAWIAVSDAARQKALADARSEASKRAMSSVSTVVVSGNKTLGDTFAIRDVGAAVDNWLTTRPVTRVNFKDDLQVEVSLGCEEHDFFNVVREALKRQKDISVPTDAKDWQRMEQDFASRYAPPIGRASAGQAHPPTARKAEFHLPTRAPQWVDERLSVAATAKGNGPKLQVRAQARQDAMAKLQERIYELKVGETTVGELAKQDPRLARAIGQVVSGAPIATEYRADGAVVVNLTPDMRDVWDQLRRAMPQ